MNLYSFVLIINKDAIYIHIITAGGLPTRAHCVEYRIRFDLKIWKFEIGRLLRFQERERESRDFQIFIVKDIFDIQVRVNI